MIKEIVPIVGREQIAEGIYVLSIESDRLASSTRPGQFLNVLAHDGFGPFLRRPFSISRVEGPRLELMFNVIGQGTRFLASRGAGEVLDVIGPLGRPFTISGNFSEAWLVGGGLGVAPFPVLTDWLVRSGKSVQTYVGARTAAQVVTRHLANPHIATDDGTAGFHGTVVDLLRSSLDGARLAGVHLFGCGPTPMLKALTDVATGASVPCELSLEGAMACGIGLCQGCPVERVGGEKRYSLVCTEGPSFDCREVVL